MEELCWYTSYEGETPCICAEFDGRTRRIRLSGYSLRGSDQRAALVRHAVEQLTLSIRATRQARAQQLAFSELH